MVTVNTFFMIKKKNDLLQNNHVCNIINLKNMTEYNIIDMKTKMQRRSRGCELKIHNEKELFNDFEESYYTNFTIRST